MKKIFTMFFAITTLFIINASFASAQYYQNPIISSNYSGYGYIANNAYNYTSYPTATYSTYQNAYQVYPTSNSYQYTQGCNTYNYDGYTRQITLVSSTCYTNTYNTYQSNNQNQYGTYHYINGIWVYGDGNNYNGCNQNQYYGYGYNNYNNCHQNYNQNNHECYWQNGYQVCY